MNDSKLKSASEAGFNTTVGFLINFGLNLIIIPPFVVALADSYVSGDTGSFIAINIYMGIIFTVTSVVRQYCFRRLFNRFGENENMYTLLKRAFK